MAANPETVAPSMATAPPAAGRPSGRDNFGSRPRPHLTPCFCSAPGDSLSKASAGPANTGIFSPGDASE
jgi:hypothetical protein